MTYTTLALMVLHSRLNWSSIVCNSYFLKRGSSYLKGPIHKWFELYTHSLCLSASLVHLSFDILLVLIGNLLSLDFISECTFKDKKWIKIKQKRERVILFKTNFLFMLWGHRTISFVRCVFDNSFFKQLFEF